MRTTRSGRRRPGWTSATARSRSVSSSGRCSACGRSITRSRRSDDERCTASIRRCGRRCGWAPTSSATWTASRATPRSTSRSSSCGGRPCASDRVHERGPAQARRRNRRATRRSPGDERRPGGPQALLPRLDRGDMVARSRRVSSARAHARAERARRGRRSPRPRRDRGHARSRDSGRVARRPGRRARAFGGPHLATEPGSRLVGLTVGARAGERALVCAAPGGKATMLPGEVVAVDVNEARARELEETVERLGASNVRVVVADGRSLPPELDGFDRALVDAPCSGLGVCEPATRSALAGRAASSCSSSSCERQQSASGREARSSTPCARSMRTRRMRSWMPPDWRSILPSLRNGPSSAIPGSPSSCRRCLTSMEPRASSSPGCGCDPRRLGSSPWPSSSWSTRSSWPSGGGGRHTRIRSSARSWSRAARSSARVGTKRRAGRTRRSPRSQTRGRRPAVRRCT